MNLDLNLIDEPVICQDCTTSQCLPQIERLGIVLPAGKVKGLSRCTANDCREVRSTELPMESETESSDRLS